MKFTSKLNQKIVYWGTPVPDGWGGNEYDSPAELDARWEDKAENVISYLGEEIVSKSVVYLADAVVEGGYIYLGEETDLDSSSDPESISDAYKVLKVSKVTSLDDSENLWMAWL